MPKSMQKCVNTIERKQEIHSMWFECEMSPSGLWVWSSAGTTVWDGCETFRSWWLVISITKKLDNAHSIPALVPG